MLVGLDLDSFCTNIRMEQTVSYHMLAGVLVKQKRNYPAQKIEFLALKLVITEKYKDYLLGHRFIVFMDNNPLGYVLTSANLDATSYRWVAALSSCDFEIKQRNRRSNVDHRCCLLFSGRNITHETHCNQLTHT